MMQCTLTCRFSGEDFAKYARDRIGRKLLAELNLLKLATLKEYFTSDAFIKSAGTSLDISGFFLFLSQHISYSKLDGAYSFYINEDQLYNNIKVGVICRSIDYGTMDIAGYPIISDTFKYFNARSEMIEDQYLGGLW